MEHRIAGWVAEVKALALHLRNEACSSVGFLTAIVPPSPGVGVQAAIGNWVFFDPKLGHQPAM